MIVRASGLGSIRNGLPDTWRPYVYRGTGVDVLEAAAPRPSPSRRQRQKGLPDRIVAALRSLGGDASTVEIRTALELDGGPPFNPFYIGVALGRLARRDPPPVVPAGRDRSGKGRPARWQLGPGAGTAESPAAQPRRVHGPAAPGDGRCRRCKYLRESQGHKNACGDAA